MRSNVPTHLSHPALPALLMILALSVSACAGGATAVQGSPEDGTPEGPTSFEGQGVVYVVGPMSGSAAEKGQAQAGGARLAAEELNALGGVLGHEILIKALDDEGTSEGALRAARKIEAAADAGERVVGVVVHEESDPGLRSFSEIFSKLGLLTVVPTSSSPVPASIDDPLLLRISASNESQGRQAADLLKRLSRPRAAMIYTSTPYGKALAGAFEEAVEGLGLQLVASVEIEPEGLSYSDVATQIKEADADGIFFAGGDTEVVVLLADLYDAVFRGVFVAADRAFALSVVDELGCRAEGMYAASVLPDATAVMSDDQLGTYSSLEFRDPGRFSVAGYSGVEVLVEALEQANSWGADAAAQAARDMSLDTLIGNVSYDSEGRLAKPRIYLFQVGGGRYGQVLASVVR